MSEKRNSILILGLVLCLSTAWSERSWGQTTGADQDAKATQTRQNWDELMHYALIGDWNLAKGYGDALLKLEPDPKLLLELAENERYTDSYRNLSLLQADSPLKEIAGKVLKLVEQGRYQERTDPRRIEVEIKRLSGTTRGRMMAMERLKDSGEWAVPLMIQALCDPNRTEENAIIRWALPQLGQAAVNPLVVVLQRYQDLGIRLLVLEALSKIGYPSALPYIREVMEESASTPEVKAAGLAAIRTIDRSGAAAMMSAALLYKQLAEDYYNHLPSLEVPANQEFANMWFWQDQTGLAPEKVQRGAFADLMTMRSCEQALHLDPGLGGAISLWLSAFFQLEAQGYKQPAYFGEHHADAGTYALTAGPEYLQSVLMRALKDRSRAVALPVIEVLQRNSGQQSLLYEIEGERPLMSALNFADREVRFSAALAIAGVIPQKNFTNSEQVMQILREALQQKGERYAIVVDANQERRNRIAAELRDSKAFAEVINDGSYAAVVEPSRRLPSCDLIVLAGDVQWPDLKETLSLIRKSDRFATCPVIVIAEVNNLAGVREITEGNSFVEVVPAEQATAADLQKAEALILTRNKAIAFDATQADAYALKTVHVLHDLALAQNKVLDLKIAEPALLEAIQGTRKEIQKVAADTLARMDSTSAQRAIATLALNEATELPVRLMAFRCLAISAKSFGNLLLAEQVSGIYQIVSSQKVAEELRNLAAEAYGSLNLPSARISQLITDQMR
jgi:hypothetical protein